MNDHSVRPKISEQRSRRLTSPVFAAFTLLCSGVSPGQDFLTSGASGVRFGWFGDRFGSIELLPSTENWQFGAQLNQVYDSNPTLRESDGDSRYYTEFRPQISWVSDPGQGALFQAGINYQPTFRWDWSDNDRNSFLNRINGFFKSEGARGSLLIYGNFEGSSGADRIAGGFVEGKLWSLGVDFSYQLAARTRALFQSQYAKSTFDTNVFSDIETKDMAIGFDWETSNGWRIGPMVRFATSKAETIGSRDVVGLLVSIEKSNAEGFSLRAEAGVDYQTIELSEENSYFLTGQLRAAGRMSDKWSWNAILRILSIPSVSETGLVYRDYQAAATATRVLPIGSIQFGTEFSLADSEAVTPGAVAEDSDFTTDIFISYQRPIFQERAFFRSRLNYSFNFGGTDWRRVELLLGLGMNF